MSSKRHSRKSRKANPIGANQQNLHNHRRLIPNLKFKEVPIIEIDVIGDGVNVIKTSNFIDRVSEYSKLPNVIEAGGFFIMRPKESDKHRYLIDPSKMNKKWNYKTHCDKHYFINNKKTNSFNSKPYNKEWVYDIPQLSKTVNNTPLLVGSYPQKTCDVIKPLFNKQKQKNSQNNSDLDSNFDIQIQFYKNQLQNKIINTDNNSNYRKRKRNETEIDILNHNNKNSKRRKLRHHNNNNNNNKQIKKSNIIKPKIKLPKQLRVPKRSNLFDLTQHISSYDIHKLSNKNNKNNKNNNKLDHIENGIDGSMSGNSDIDSSHSFPTSTSSFNDIHINNYSNSNSNGGPICMDYNNNNNNENEDDDIVILSTNINPIENVDTKSFDIQLWDKILSKKEITPPITITDMAIDNHNHNHNHNKIETETESEIELKLPSLDIPQLIPSTNSPPLNTKIVSLSDANNIDINTDNTENKNSNINIEMEEEEEEEEEEKEINIQSYRGFAFVLNQFEEENMEIESFWEADEFEERLLSSPYDNISPENIPLIFANDLLNNSRLDNTCYYGIIGNNVTMYDETSPLDLINLSLYGPFAEFREGGNNNEYMQGVHSPYIYLGNKSTWFAWHREDMNLYAVNHLLWGCSKLWYSVPPKYTSNVLDFVRIQYKDYCGDNSDNSCWTPLQHKQFWFDPYILLSMGIPVYFCRQKPGDIIITPPGGLHAGLNTGPNMAESLNFMTYDIQCWKTCLSAMHFSLFNNCKLCLNSVWINFNQLAHRCRSNNKCHGMNKKYAPSKKIVPFMDAENNYNMNKNICQRLTKKQRLKKKEFDPISKAKGEKLWVYPVKREDSKYWYPGIWIENCYAWDSLQFEMLYSFKYLDSGTIKGRNNVEHFGENDVLWDKGLLILDWNRKQRFKPLTQKDKKKYPLAKKYSYPRRQGNMLLNYYNILNKDYVNMYYQKSIYYIDFPNEVKYKDLYKKHNNKNNNFRTYQQMIKDIDKQHTYFMKGYKKNDKYDYDDKNCSDFDSDIDY